ncbi:MAG: hypothetical protein K2Q18_15400 [Bdellovibrionales bacterium]|nr:hypothetical protein [Bdellovibrionales bacterium]
MKLFLNLVLLLSLSAAMTSCGVSPEEKEQRRSDAFDISGSYAISASGTGMNLEIKNEGGNRSNVYVVVDRNGFTSKEEQAFASEGIPLNMVEKFRTNFEVGKGKDLMSYLTGGENISTDGGITTKVSLSTSTSEGLDAGDYSVHYFFYARMIKGSSTLSGTLTMYVRKYATINGQKQETSSHSYDIPFTAKTENTFSTQYFGMWSGTKTMNIDALNAVFYSVSFTQRDFSTYIVTCAKNSFDYDGETYTLSNNSRPTSDFSNLIAPKVNFEFSGNRGSRMRVLGNIYSLGRYSGVVTLNDEQVGNFQFIKR